jgi:sialic acid synthase SpsE
MQYNRLTAIAGTYSRGMGATMMFDQIFIVAEAGSNHNGDLDTAVELVQRAAEAGADAIKFQDFSLDALFAPEHYERALGLKNHDWQRHIENVSVRREWHDALSRAAVDSGIHYFSTPFSFDAIERLDRFVPFYKIASGDITHLELIEHVARQGKGVFLSTGGAYMAEIEKAVSIVEKYDVPFLCIMHCIMLYPPPDEAMHLRFIDTLRDRFDHPIGFSDHSLDGEAACMALAKGVRVIEKHFTLDRNQEGSDHALALDPPGLKRFVLRLRRCEVLLGSRDRPVSGPEARERVFARRGIYAARDLHAGDILNRENICFLRPNIGIGAEDFDGLKNRGLTTDVTKGTPLSRDMFEEGAEGELRE